MKTETNAEELQTMRERMHKKYEENIAWLKGFHMDDEDVARIKTESPELWADFVVVEEEVGQAMYEDDEDLFLMGFARMRDLLEEIIANAGIKAPEVAEEDSATVAET